MNLSTVESLLGTAQARFPLITIHPEERWPDTCYIGTVELIGRKRLWLKKIDSKAQWIEPEGFKPREVTRVSFGGYEEALWMVSEDRRRSRESEAAANA